MMVRNSNCFPVSRRALAPITLLLLTAAASAQEGGAVAAQRAWTITPRISVTATATDNGNLGRGARRSDQILELAPGVKITAQGARLKGNLDYSLRESLRQHTTASGIHQNSLNTVAALEAVENWMFVDFSGIIAQQSLSALGTQSASTSSVNANRTETSTYRLSPYIKGKLFGRAEYQVRYGLSTTNSKSALATNSRNEDWLARIGSGRQTGKIGWSLEASGQKTRFGGGAQNESDRLRGTIALPATDQLTISLIAGQESNNFQLNGRERRSTTGFGVDWTPTPRTKVSFEQEQRFFGTGHHLGLEHRTPRTVWRFNSSRDVSASPGQSTQAGTGSVFDLFFTQFASLEPDPIARALLVDAFLRTNGIAPDAVVNTGFLTSGLTVSRKSDFSVAFLGARNTLTFLFSRGETSRGGLIAPAGGLPTDDLSTNSGLKQSGFNVTFAHKLSGLASLNAVASQQKTSGTSGLETKLRSLNLGVTRKMGPQTSASVTARHTEFDSTLNPYTENALTGTLAVQF